MAVEVHRVHGFRVVRDRHMHEVALLDELRVHLIDEHRLARILVVVRGERLLRRSVLHHLDGDKGFALLLGQDTIRHGSEPDIGIEADLMVADDTVSRLSSLVSPRPDFSGWQ